MIQGKGNKGPDLIDVLKQVSDKEKLTGVINSVNPDRKISSKVFIKEGQVVYATSTMYRSRFGDLMIKKGIITHKELTAALGLQKENSKQTFIGEILVGMGVISERVIPNLLYHQIEVVIFEIISWNNANISFELSNIDEDPDYKRPVANIEGKVLYSDLNKLVDSGAFVKYLEHNLSPLLQIRHHLGDPDAVPKRVMKNYPSQLTFDQRKILRAIDGANTLNDIIILSDLDYFRTYKILFDLAEERVISIPGVIWDDDENQIPVNQNPVEAALSPSTTQETSEPSAELTAQEASPQNQDDFMLKYQKQYLAGREEIKQLQLKVNDYENSKLVLNEDITLRVSRLPYNKKMMLNSALKNILDMVESI